MEGTVLVTKTERPIFPDPSYRVATMLFKHFLPDHCFSFKQFVMIGRAEGSKYCWYSFWSIHISCWQRYFFPLWFTSWAGEQVSFGEQRRYVLLTECVAYVLQWTWLSFGEQTQSREWSKNFYLDAVQILFFLICNFHGDWNYNIGEL